MQTTTVTDPPTGLYPFVIEIILTRLLYIVFLCHLTGSVQPVVTDCVKPVDTVCIQPVSTGCVQPAYRLDAVSRDWLRDMMYVW